MEGEYVGQGRTLAGPYLFGFDGGRDEVLGKYRRWLFAQVKAKDKAFHKLTELLELAKGPGGLVLVCLQVEIGEVIKGCLEWLNKGGVEGGGVERRGVEGGGVRVGE